MHQREDAEQEDLAASLTEVPEVEDCWSVAGEEAFVVEVRSSRSAGRRRVPDARRPGPGQPGTGTGRSGQPPSAAS